MASHTSTPRTPRSRSRSRSPVSSTASSDTTMHDAPLPVRPRPASHTPAPAASPATFSLLLSLPRELRDRIYAFTLSSSLPFTWPARAPKPHGVGVSLLRVSRQVYAEAAPVLYSANAFLFTHPSDCNIFRVVASPFAAHIATVYFRVRDREVRLWTHYLQSKTKERGVRADLPALKHLWLFLRCGGPRVPLNALHPNPHAHAAQGLLVIPPGLAAAQSALAQHVGALQAAGAGATARAPQGVGVVVPTGAPSSHPTPHYHPLPPPQHQHPHPHPHPAALHHNHNHTPNQNPPPPPPPPQIPRYTPPGPYPTFLRFDRESGIETLCAALSETRRPDTNVRIVCNMRVPRAELSRLVRAWPGELSVDRGGDARTGWRRVAGGVGDGEGKGEGGVQVCLEISGFD